MPPAKSSARVQQALVELGIDCRVRELPASTHTAADAAAALQCEIAQIAKSLVFRTADESTAVLIIASGANRVDETSVSRLLGTRIVKADADFVREVTGFAIGGVPPVGHRQPLTTLIDEDLLQHETIWAAAGTPRSVCELPTRALERLTGGRITAVA